ncbi:MAG: class I SAM-dependent methyltransferase [Calditrichaeota bacterium]|nr:MAG: class I SAM-dependent methyltransferase [Calditrichota bacterium]
MTENLLNKTQDSEEKFAFHWDTSNSTALGKYLINYEWKFINRWLPINELPVRILDVGCGSGRLSKLLLKNKMDVVSMDANASALRLLKQHCPQAKTVISDAHSTPFADQSFDRLLAIQCFEYLDTNRFVRECARLLADEGILILQALNRNNYRRHIRKLANTVFNRPLWENEERFTTAELFDMLVENGFSIKAVTGYYWLPFNRHSKSHLVNSAAFLEKALFLNSFYMLSPWVLICAQKRG